MEILQSNSSFFGRIYLENLVTHVLKISYNAYDALEDSKVLQRLTELPQHAIKEHYLIHSFDATSTFKIVSFQSQVKQNFKTLKPLVVKNIISENMAKKTSQSGLSYLHFKLTFSKKKNKRKLEIFLQRKPMAVSELSNRKNSYFFSHKFYPIKITLSIRRKTKTFTWIVCKHIQRNIVF